MCGEGGRRRRRLNPQPTSERASVLRIGAATEASSRLAGAKFDSPSLSSPAPPPATPGAHSLLPPLPPAGTPRHPARRFRPASPHLTLPAQLPEELLVLELAALVGDDPRHGAAAGQAGAGQEGAEPAGRPAAAARRDRLLPFSRSGSSASSSSPSRESRLRSAPLGFSRRCHGG